MLSRLCIALLLAAGTSAWAGEIACPPGTLPNEEDLGGPTAAWCELATDRSQLHGPYRAWYSNGTLGTEEHYVRGQANGKASYRWGSGHRQAEGSYKANVRDGWWRFWDKNGAPAGRVRYRNGAIVAGELPRWAADWDGTPAGLRPPSGDGQPPDAQP